MNDICFTNVLIRNITDKGKYKLLSCTTQIPGENNNYFNATVFVYMDSSLFREKNENKRTKDIMTVNKSICVTGKTVHEIKNGQISFNILVQNSRRIEIARNKCEVIVKLFDVYIEDKFIHQSNLLTNREEVLCKYFNDDKKSQQREVIVSIPKNKTPILKDNTSFNLSGSFIIRCSANKFYPIILTKTFVKDKILKENIYLRDLDNQRR